MSMFFNNSHLTLVNFLKPHNCQHRAVLKQTLDSWGVFFSLYLLKKKTLSWVQTKLTMFDKTQYNSQGQKTKKLLTIRTQIKYKNPRNQIIGKMAPNTVTQTIFEKPSESPVDLKPAASDKSADASLIETIKSYTVHWLHRKDVKWHNVVLIFTFNFAAIYGFICFPYLQHWKTFLVGES